MLLCYYHLVSKIYYLLIIALVHSRKQLLRGAILFKRIVRTYESDGRIKLSVEVVALSL